MMCILYQIYIFKVLKQVHPNLSVTTKAMAILDSFVNDLYDRFCDEAAKLCKYSGRQTMTAREVRAATSLVLPGELSKHAQSEATKAVNKYYASIKK